MFSRTVSAEESLTSTADEVIVIANLGDGPVTLSLPFSGSRKEYFSGKTYGGGDRVTIAPWGWMVF